MKTYLYVCRKCGYDTATYDKLVRCLNCRSGRESLALIGTADDPDIGRKLAMVRGELRVDDALRKLGV